MSTLTLKSAKFQRNLLMNNDNFSIGVGSYDRLKTSVLPSLRAWGKGLALSQLVSGQRKNLDS